MADNMEAFSKGVLRIADELREHSKNNTKDIDPLFLSAAVAGVMPKIAESFLERNTKTIISKFPKRKKDMLVAKLRETMDTRVHEVFCELFEQLNQKSECCEEGCSCGK